MLDDAMNEEELSDDEFGGYLSCEEIETCEDLVPCEEIPDQEFDDFTDYFICNEPACTVDMASKSVLDFFKLLISDEILSSIADQTNLYADQYICSNTVKPKSRASAWKQVPHDAAEVEKFVATIIVMGLHYDEEQVFIVDEVPAPK
ncbi:hypothetical protein EMCRGX_G000256 [Ephydatia muelleri]